MNVYEVFFPAKFPRVASPRLGLSPHVLAGLKIYLTSAATGGKAEVYRTFASVCRTLEGGAEIPGCGVATLDTGLASSRTRVSIPAFGVPIAGRGVGSPRAGARHPGSSETLRSGTERGCPHPQRVGKRRGTFERHPSARPAACWGQPRSKCAPHAMLQSQNTSSHSARSLSMISRSSRTGGAPWRSISSWKRCSEYAAPSCACQSRRSLRICSLPNV